MTFADHLRDDAVAIHERQLGELGQPGTWLDGAERIGIAKTVRRAMAEAGLADANADEASEADSSESMEEPVRRLAARLATNPQGVDKTFCQQVLDAGVTDERYVEVVGLVARLTNIDIVRRGVGAPPQPLPTPQPGAPSQIAPTTAKREGAWLPTVPFGKAGGEDAIAIYGSTAMMPFIIRALSLVPAETHRHLELEQAQYLPLNQFPNFQYQHHAGLTRPQVELVAGRVSAINECFY